MSDEVSQEIKEQIVAFFKQKGKMMTHRDVAKGLKLDQKLVKKALTELINDGLLEFTSYGGATFIKLPEE